MYKGWSDTRLGIEPLLAATKLNRSACLWAQCTWWTLHGITRPDCMCTKLGYYFYNYRAKIFKFLNCVAKNKRKHIKSSGSILALTSLMICRNAPKKWHLQIIIPIIITLIFFFFPKNSNWIRIEGKIQIRGQKNINISFWHIIAILQQSQI